MRRTRPAPALPFASAVLLACALFAAPPVIGHGASRGLHLHVAPEPASPGEEVRLTVDAEAPMKEIRAAFVDHEEVRVEVEPPSRQAAVVLKVPEPVESDVIGVQVEATTDEGKTLRASAILRLTPCVPADP